MIHGKFVEVQPVMDKFIPKGVNFYYFCGGRGIGKTYSALDLCYKIGTGQAPPHYGKGKFMYLRRTKTEAESVASPEGNTFKKYCLDENVTVSPDWNDKLGFGNFYVGSTDEQQHIGYIAGLSTFSNLRGVDFSDVSFILFDECVPEKKRGTIDREGRLLLNMLETVNRNRSILGEQEVILCMLSNAIDLGAPLLSDLLLTPVLNNMIVNNQQRYTDYSRSLHIEKYVNHQISCEKANSALYKFASGTGFDEESLSGEFVLNDLTLITKSVNLAEFECYMSIENVYIYTHKSIENMYISMTPSTPKYKFRVTDKLKVRELLYWNYKLYRINNRVRYDNYQTKVIFDAMINYKEPI